MKRIISFLLCLILTAGIASAANPVPDFSIMPEGAVVMEVSTGQVLYDKNMNEKYLPASITKVMTALIALEQGKLTDVLTVSEHAVYSVTGSSHIALAPGEVLTLEEALYGLLLPSANDCAVAIAEYIGGSEETFVKMMNDRAKELGANKTHFSNPHGLHAEDHFSTAYDMALITREAMKHPDFVRISGTVLYTMSPTNLQTESRSMANQNAMLKAGDSYYEYARFGKNGYTSQANNTMVVEAKRGSLELICVVMNCQNANQKYADAAKLLDFCYDNFYKTKIDNAVIQPPVAKLSGWFGSIGQVDFSLTEDVEVMLPNGTGTEQLDYSYNIKKSYKKAKEYTASVTVSVDGNELFQIPLKGTATKKVTFYNVVKTIFIILLLFVLFIAGVVAYYIIDAERKKKKRRKDRIRRTLRVKKDL